MNVLVAAAHPDDEIIGCGATLRRLADEGANIYTCVLCGNVEARHNRPELDRLNTMAAEAARAVGVRASLKFDFENIKFNVVPHLDLVNAVEQAIMRFRPSWLFTHHPGDLNIDHRLAYDATMAALRLPQRLSADLDATMIRKVLLFEVPSSTDWASPLDQAFVPNAFFDVRRTFASKMKALEHFEGALKPHPHGRSPENIRNLASLRGGQVGIELAEAFYLVRELVI